eukprot:TRINITY_DN711_c0_g1_i1.p5 TRINITY_DN711_c0_g1~~TRINITY_DN711_c0_g1_i1.p5  ORF type:complete len:103 (-),score=3.93 TRINITY_DN711_c0_g1_i1:335-643(-)
MRENTSRTKGAPRWERPWDDRGRRDSARVPPRNPHDRGYPQDNKEPRARRGALKAEARELFGLSAEASTSNLATALAGVAALATLPKGTGAVRWRTGPRARG